MTTELPPQAHEVTGTAAMQLLGYTYLASVRKLKDLGEIEGRKIGRDWWYDRTTIDAYNERRRPVGRRPIEDVRGDDPERVKMRLYQRDRRAAAKKGAKKGAAKKAAKRAASPAGGKGRAAAGARKSAGAAARGGSASKKAGAVKKGGARKGRR